MTNIGLRADINEYTNRVLGVIKEKFGLKDKSQALDKFAELYGDDFIEREAKPEIITEVMGIISEHHKRHPGRKMTLKELDRLTGM